jgi:hypothetical protein
MKIENLLTASALPDIQARLQLPGTGISKKLPLLRIQPMFFAYVHFHMQYGHAMACPYILY